MADNTLPATPSPEELLLQEAIEAVEAKNYPHAREVLTRLLQENQQNPLYWLWMSTASATHKEKVYCLHTALQLDPENETAKRGLVILNAAENVEPRPPFPLHLPRPWEARLKARFEKPKTKLSLQAGLRMAVAALVITLALGGIFTGIQFFSKKEIASQTVFSTARPTVTPYKTSNAPVATSRPKPLAELLSVAYTATPIYAATPHSESAGDSYRGALHAYENGQWEYVAMMMAQVATTQPGSADALYFIGEANRFSGKAEEASRFYKQAISVNPRFAPSYLGLARVNRELLPGVDVSEYLNQAIQLDPYYAEAYIERGLYYLNKKDFTSAQADLEKAKELQPSAQAELNLARVYLVLGQNEAAVTAAQTANQMDLTMLDGYLVLGMAYRANNQVEKAVEALETYLRYQPDNAEAFAVLGTAYLNRGNYTLAEKNLLLSLSLSATNPEAYLGLGQTYLALKKYDQSLKNFEQARILNPDSFEASEGLANVYIGKGEYNNAYIALIKVEKSAETPAQRAHFLYIRALSLEKLDQPGAAFRDWNALLALSPDATTTEMRETAKEKIASLQSPTPSATPTPKPGTIKPSKTPRPTDTRVPTSTP